MSAVLLTSYITTGIVSTIICPELLIKSVSSITSGLMKSISYLINISHSDIELQKILLTSDINEDIKILKNFIEEEKNIKNNGKTIIECINNLNKTLFELEEIVKTITVKIEYNKTIWFSYFRSHNLNNDKELLSLLINQLKHRFEIMFKLYSMLKIIDN